MKNYSEDDPGIYRKRFLAIVDELRLALGYDLNDAEPEHGEELAMEMMYGNFDFSVVHSTLHKIDSVLIECIFGPVPEGSEELVLVKLLQMNAALAELDGSVFCLDDEGRILIYTLRIDIKELNGNQLLSKMTEIVWHGRRWLETRFVENSLHNTEAPVSPVQLA